MDAAGESYSSARARNRVSQWTRAVCKRAGAPGAGFHTLRHTAASWSAQAGRPLQEIQGVLGHTEIQTTMRYAHLQPEHLRSVIAAIDANLAEVDTKTDTCHTACPVSP